ncbi:hypothetical protein OIU76_004808 [Salix suchowensis]|nr:hypothetical protein OIU76_004808 [Salix suchowensis]
MVVAAAAQPKKSWIPAVKGGGSFVDPEWLDGSLPGDYGFDPLGLGKDPAFLKWHGAASPGSRPVLTPVPLRPSPSARSSARSSFSWAGWRASGGWISSTPSPSPWSGQRHGRKLRRTFVNATGDQGYPGGKFFDPLGFAGTLKNGAYIPDEEKLERLKLAEIKHARLAMLAMLIFYFEAGQGKTPLGALGL